MTSPIIAVGLMVLTTSARVLMWFASWAYFSFSLFNPPTARSWKTKFFLKKELLWLMKKQQNIWDYRFSTIKIHLHLKHTIILPVSGIHNHTIIAKKLWRRIQGILCFLDCDLTCMCILWWSNQNKATNSQDSTCNFFQFLFKNFSPKFYMSNSWCS